MQNSDIVAIVAVGIAVVAVFVPILIEIMRRNYKLDISIEGRLVQRTPPNYYMDVEVFFYNRAQTPRIIREWTAECRGRYSGSWKMYKNHGVLLVQPHSPSSVTMYPVITLSDGEQFDEKAVEIHVEVWYMPNKFLWFGKTLVSVQATINSLNPRSPTKSPYAAADAMMKEIKAIPASVAAANPIDTPTEKATE